MNNELASFFDGKAFAMTPAALISMLRAAEHATPDAIRSAQTMFAAQTAPSVPIYGNVAVITASGPIVYRASWMSYYFGAMALETLWAQLTAAMADPSVKTIVIRWNSPGGTVEMVPEFADDLRALVGAQSSKDIISIADTMIASAAYWIAAQSTAIYATTSSKDRIDWRLL